MAKASMWWRRLLVIRIRSPLQVLRANWRALNRPADPGIPIATKRNNPRCFSHALWLTRLESVRLEKMLARASLRCGGSSMVWRTVSRIQPSTTFLVAQLPSPLSSFLMDTASLRYVSVPGWASTWSTARRRTRLCLRSRLLPPCPTRMKSSTKTSALARGFENGRLEGGAVEGESLSLGW